MSNITRRDWYRDLTPYHWFVFAVATAGWCFDCLDQRLFSLARIPALTALMPDTPTGEIQAMGKTVTAVFLIGWGIGGVIFGALGDRYGRARMLTITILTYSLFTGLTFFSQTTWDFTLFRFLTGLGVGGVFGLAVSLIAETLPPQSRVGALGTLQILSTVGNLAAAGFNSYFNHLQVTETIKEGTAWRYMFLVGALPALLIIFTGKYLREPEAWLRAKEAGQLPKGNLLAPYLGLLSDRRWRKNLLVGAIIASTGVVGLWAIAEYSIDLQRYVFRQYYEAQNIGGELSDKEVSGQVADAISRAYLLYMIGAAVGMWLFTRVTMAIGRRLAFAIAFSSTMAITMYVFWKMNTPSEAYWMMFIMGAAHLASFAGFAIYLPELFPSRLRSTGTSFCYNIGRFAAAGGSFFSATLATRVYGDYGSPFMERYSAMTMCAIFLVGLAILPFAPETKNQPLPE